MVTRHLMKIRCPRAATEGAVLANAHAERRPQVGRDQALLGNVLGLQVADLGFF